MSEIRSGVGEMLSRGTVPKLSLPKLPAVEQRDRTPEVRAIWERAEPAAGALAEAYLLLWGISPAYPTALRFLRLPAGNLGMTPCLVYAVQDVSGEVIGVQRIFLAPDGVGKAAMPKPKLALGSIQGGAIRLGQPDGTLLLGAMLGGPVWVSSGTSNLPAMQFPPEVPRPRGVSRTGGWPSVS